MNMKMMAQQINENNASNAKKSIDLNTIKE